MNLGMKVIKAVTMALSAVYDRLTNKKVTLLRILTAALGMSERRGEEEEKRTEKMSYFLFVVKKLSVPNRPLCPDRIIKALCGGILLKCRRNRPHYTFTIHLMIM